jgi:hypothetical protein
VVPCRYHALSRVTRALELVEFSVSRSVTCSVVARDSQTQTPLNEGSVIRLRDI